MTPAQLTTLRTVARMAPADARTIHAIVATVTDTLHDQPPVQDIRPILQHLQARGLVRAITPQMQGHATPADPARAQVQAANDTTWEPTDHGRQVLRSYAGGTRPTTAAPRDTTQWATTGNYTAPELRPYTGRPGAMDAHNLPSLIGGKLVPPKGAR